MAAATATKQAGGDGDDGRVIDPFHGRRVVPAQSDEAQVQSDERRRRLKSSDPVATTDPEPCSEERDAGHEHGDDGMHARAATTSAQALSTLPHRLADKVHTLLHAVVRPRTNEKRTFVYGNYDAYYGYRYAGGVGVRGGGVLDPRLAAMSRHWFEDKDCLDIGCNTGQVTVAIAAQFRVRSMLGVDIDAKLIRRARSLLKSAQPLAPPATPVRRPAHRHRHQRQHLH